MSRNYSLFSCCISSRWIFIKNLLIVLCMKKISTRNNNRIHIMRPKQNDSFHVVIQIWLRCVTKGLINSMPALVKKIGWRRTSHYLNQCWLNTRHIYTTRPQCVKFPSAILISVNIIYCSYLSIVLTSQTWLHWLKVVQHIFVPLYSRWQDLPQCTLSCLLGSLPTLVFFYTMVNPVYNIHIYICSDSQSAEFVEWVILALNRSIWTPQHAFVSNQNISPSVAIPNKLVNFPF